MPDYDLPRRRWHTEHPRWNLALGLLSLPFGALLLLGSVGAVEHGRNAAWLGVVIWTFALGLQLRLLPRRIRAARDPEAGRREWLAKREAVLAQPRPVILRKAIAALTIWCAVMLAVGIFGVLDPGPPGAGIVGWILIAMAVALPVWVAVRYRRRQRATSDES